MITFKQFLQEKAMNKSVYADVIAKLSDRALVGFEIEFRVDPSSDFHSKHEPAEPPSIELKDIKSLAQLKQIFELEPSDEADIRQDFADWVSDKEDEAIDDKWEDYMTDDDVEEMGRARAEKAARAAAMKRVDKSKFTFDAWTNELGGIYDFVRRSKIHPKFGYAEENGDESWVYTQAKEKGDTSWSKTADMIAQELGERVEDEVHVFDQPGGSSRFWKIVPDTSITDGVEYSDQMTGLGMEIVSPPLPVNDAISALEKTLAMLDELDFETNDTTGIHLNMSIRDLMKTVDPLKLIMFIGDEHILKVFNRVGNNYAKPQIKSIIDGIQATGEVPATGHELMDIAQRAISTGKFTSVNIGKLEHGYVEFRSMGGANYHREVEKIKEALGRWLTALDIACDPHAERQEYLKKVAKLLGRTYDSQTAENTQLSFDDLAKKIDPESWGRLKRADNAADAMRPAVQLATAVGQKYGKQEPTVKQIAEVRKEFKRLGITAEKLRYHQQLQRIGTPEAVEKFIKLMKVS